MSLSLPAAALAARHVPTRAPPRPRAGVRRAARLALLLLAIGGGAGCRESVADGIRTATDLMFHQQHADAERLLRKLLREVDGRAAGDVLAARQRVVILSRLGALNSLYLRHSRQAVADYEALVAQAPTAEESLTALKAIAALGERRLGQPELAIHAYRRIVQNFGGRPEARQAQAALVDARLAEGDVDAARHEAQALAQRWPKGAEAVRARVAVAEALAGTQRHAEANADLEIVLAERPPADLAAEALFALGGVTEVLADGEAALGYYYAALPAHPRPALVERKIARLRARLAHLAPAHRILNAAGPRGGRRGRRGRPRLAAEQLPAVAGPPAALERPEVPLAASQEPEPSPSAPLPSDGAPFDPLIRKQPHPDEAS